MDAGAWAINDGVQVSHYAASAPRVNGALSHGDAETGVLLLTLRSSFWSEALKASAKEKPIIFGADSVRAILSGAKTQTRRVVKHDVDDELFSNDSRYRLWHASECPYQPTQQLWVREGHRIEAGDYEEGWARVRYKSDEKHKNVKPAQWPIDVSLQWRSPIHMPRWASRITLEVTGVRVERLQEITDEDAKAEGVDGCRDMRFAVAFGNIHSTGHRLNFIDHWDKINVKKHPYSGNPWVWVITFKRLTPC